MYCVIMAGGKGTRFWPRSRTARPKQLISIVSERTMIQKTIDRIADLVPHERILIVTGQDQAAELKKQVPEIPEANILVEPFGRNTAPCICIAALKISQIDPGESMLVLPADHYIENTAAFCDCLRAADEAARATGSLITIGIKPSRPEIGYGYIQAGEPAGTFHDHQFYTVNRFHEKPDSETAQRFVGDEAFLWNSGMFAWTVSAILRELRRFLPDMCGHMEAIAPFLDSTVENASISVAYKKIDSVSIDYGVMEKADTVLTVKGDFGWNDIGSWSALYDVLACDGSGNAFQGNIISEDSENNLVLASQKLIALVGVENLIVVDTEDALLVCARDRAQDVRKIVATLEKNRLESLL